MTFGRRESARVDREAVRFEDDPTSPRLLLRLWLSVPNGRPVDPRFRMRAETYERIYRERQAQPG